MAVSYNPTINTARLSLVSTAADAGTGAAILLILDGVRPSTGGTLTNTLCQATMSDPSFSAPSGNTMTANTISANNPILLSGTATWFRLTDSEGTFVLDGDVGTDMTIDNAMLVQGGLLNISSLTITSSNI